MAQENKHSLKQEVFEVKPVWRNFSISSSGLKAEDWQNGWLIIHPHS
jgi:hypothetical protein